MAIYLKGKIQRCAHVPPKSRLMQGSQPSTVPTLKTANTSILDVPSQKIHAQLCPGNALDQPLMLEANAGADARHRPGSISHPAPVGIQAVRFGVR